MAHLTRFFSSTNVENIKPHFLSSTFLAKLFFCFFPTRTNPVMASVVYLKMNFNFRPMFGESTECDLMDDYGWMCDKKVLFFSPKMNAKDMFMNRRLHKLLPGKWKRSHKMQVALFSGNNSRETSLNKFSFPLLFFDWKHKKNIQLHSPIDHCVAIACETWKLWYENKNSIFRLP